MRRSMIRALAISAAGIGATMLWRARGELARRARYLRGAANGAWYRIRGRRPDPRVSDDVLTQRVRSALGGLQKLRDLPRVHVMVENGLVLLHGELPAADDVAEIERRVLEVSGVYSIESYLHVGLASGTTRPSAGRAAQADRPSEARRALLQAATGAGAEDDAVAAVHRGAGCIHRPHPRGRTRTTALSPAP